MGILKVDDLSPDGVPIFVDWGAMHVGCSVFVPSINTSSAIKQVGAVFARREWQMRVVIATEHRILGVRIWRIA